MPAACLLIFLLGFISLRNLFVQSLALEQQARCGMEEHIHGEDCYREEKLVCSKAEHTHTENCYLVLLKDNDINVLLNYVQRQPDNSLESLIGQTVDSALLYNHDLTAPMAEGEQLPVSVATINETIVENDIQPQVTFNEDLYKTTAASDGQLPDDPSGEQGSTEEMGIVQAALSRIGSTQSGQTQTGISSSVSPMSLDDPVSTGTYQANYYVYLDGAWRTVGTMEFAVQYTNRRYTARQETLDILTLYNQSLGTTLAEEDLNLIYATSANAASYSWTNATQSGNYTYFGTNYSRQSTARNAKYIRLVDANGDPLAFYTVTYEYPDGTQQVQYLRSGDTVVLPEEYNWATGDAEYAGGSEVEIYAATTFTAQEADGNFRIAYDVNFPTSISGVTVETEPTLMGLAQTEITDVLEGETDTRVRNVSLQEVRGSVNSSGYGLSRVVYFAGWQIEGTDTILSPNSTVTWQELQAYADGGSRLKLTGVWEYNAVQTVSFYIRYDSVAVDTEGNITNQDSNLYTPELFAAHVGGEDAKTLSVSALNNLYAIADTTSDNSYGADQKIRALYGNNTGIWLTSFPNDEDVFELLKNYATNLEVEGETVSVYDLNANAYAIRWYVFKCQDDAWHVDGRLVKKEGFLDVTKHFAGNQEAVALAKEGFYMEAYDDDGDHSYLLYITEPETAAQDGTVLVPSSSDGTTYTWHIGEVEYDELWIVREYPQQSTLRDMVVHSSYRVIDGYNNQNQSGDGTEVQVHGVTYATDMGDAQALRVEFTNIYHTTNSIIIKKEDAATGSPLGGAVFTLMQNGQALHFTYDADAERYLYDPYGGVTELTGNGYYELVIEGFSYDNGPVEVQELQAPEGYTPVESIQLGLLDDGTVGILNETTMAEYDNGLLVVKNSTDSTFVSVAKQWLCPEEEQQPVTVQLLANGQPVTALIPGVEPSVVLELDNGYTAVWQDLPEYANGEKIVWSVRETHVGNEPCLSDFTFANWLVDYNQETVYDAYGEAVGTAFTVTNDTRRTMLRVIKTNMGGGIRLKGAVFTLEQLLSDGSADPDFIVRTGTTAEDGTLTFDNLKYGFYRLTEIQSPSGHLEMTTPIYLTIEQDGTVTVQSHPYAESGTTAFTIHIKNQPESPLPSTGGRGTGLHIALGLVLMFLSMGGILFRHRKKGGFLTG